jgi:hypothetical protein
MKSGLNFCDDRKVPLQKSISRLQVIVNKGSIWLKLGEPIQLSPVSSRRDQPPPGGKNIRKRTFKFAKSESAREREPTHNEGHRSHSDDFMTNFVRGQRSK